MMASILSIGTALGGILMVDICGTIHIMTLISCTIRLGLAHIMALVTTVGCMMHIGRAIAMVTLVAGTTTTIVMNIAVLHAMRKRLGMSLHTRPIAPLGHRTDLIHPLLVDILSGQAMQGRRAILGEVVARSILKVQATNAVTKLAVVAIMEVFRLITPHSVAQGLARHELGVDVRRT